MKLFFIRFKIIQNIHLCLRVLLKLYINIQLRFSTIATSPRGWRENQFKVNPWRKGWKWHNFTISRSCFRRASSGLIEWDFYVFVEENEAIESRNVDVNKVEFEGAFMSVVFPNEFIRNSLHNDVILTSNSKTSATKTIKKMLLVIFIWFF